MNALEEALHRLIATTTVPPPGDAPVGQLLALADAIAREREPTFRQMRELVQNGARLTDVARSLVAQLESADRSWRDRLDMVREHIDSQRAQTTAPRGRVSAYLSR